MDNSLNNPAKYSENLPQPSKVPENGYSEGAMLKSLRSLYKRYQNPGMALPEATEYERGFDQALDLAIGLIMRFSISPNKDSGEIEALRRRLSDLIPEDKKFYRVAIDVLRDGDEIFVVVDPDNEDD